MGGVRVQGGMAHVLEPTPEASKMLLITSSVHIAAENAVAAILIYELGGFLHP